MPAKGLTAWNNSTYMSDWRWHLIWLVYYVVVSLAHGPFMGVQQEKWGRGDPVQTHCYHHSHLKAKPRTWISITACNHEWPGGINEHQTVKMSLCPERPLLDRQDTTEMPEDWLEIDQRRVHYIRVWESEVYWKLASRVDNYWPTSLSFRSCHLIGCWEKLVLSTLECVAFCYVAAVYWSM